MISYNLNLYSYLKLYYDVINVIVMFLSDYVTYQFVLCSVVSKHLLLVLSFVFIVKRGLPVGYLLLQYSVLCTVESFSLLYLLFIS